MRILLVEDDLQIGSTLKRALQFEGYACDWATELNEATEYLASAIYDLLVLDWMLPDGEGPTFLKGIRRNGFQIPAILLTARTTVEDRIEGLDSGADDYLCKTFDLNELLARIRALLRRRVVEPSHVHSNGKISLDVTALTVTTENETHTLSKSETAILEKLIHNAGRYVSKTELENAIYDWDDEVSPNALEAHISRLRRRIGRDSIKTMRGVGYTVEAN